MGFYVEQEYGPRSLKAQMKRADRLGCKRALIVGDRELESGKAILRDMRSKQQVEIEITPIVDRLAEMLKGEIDNNADGN